MEHIYEFVEKAEIGDDILASYILSLALTVFLRRGLHLEGTPVKGLFLAPHPRWELLLIREMLAPSISGLSVTECSFPKLTIDSINFTELVLDSCDFEVLRIVSSDFYKCSIVGLECKELRLKGKTSFQQSILDMEEGSVVIDEDANVEFRNCKVSSDILEVLEKHRLEGYDIVLDNVTAIQPPAVIFTPLSNGRRFLNRIMAFARRGGRKEFSVYQYKLRDRTPGTDEQFLEAISCLEDKGCIRKQLSWIILTPSATDHMYSFRPSEEPKYESYRDFWDPIVEELDQILQ